MAWPDDRDLPVEVEAAFGADLRAASDQWTWTDLTRDASGKSRLTNDPIRIRAGKSGGASFVSPGTCTVNLLNDDSALTPLHPLSPYWPNVEMGTPLRVRLRRDEDAFGRTVSSSWGRSDSDRQWSTAGGLASDYSVSGGAGRHAHTTVNNLRITYLPNALVDSEQVVDVAPSALLTGAALVTGVIARHTATTYYWLRCEFNAGGTNVALKISKYVDGTATELAVLSPLPAVAYAANTYLRVRASVVGTRLAMKVWPAAGVEPLGWQLTATDDSITVPGRTGMQSWLVSGNTNTLPVTALHKNYVVRTDRFNGFADQWEPRYIPVRPGETASAVRITASGILRRLSQGNPPALSPLRRAIAATSPAAYWPGEDGIASRSLASAITGHPPMTVTGAVEFVDIADYEGTTVTFRYGSAALVNLAGGGRLFAQVPGDVTAATATEWTVMARGDVNPAVIAGDFVLVEWTTPGGTYVRWQVVVGTINSRVVGYNSAGTPTTLMTGGLPLGLAPWSVSAIQTGGNMTLTFRAEIDYLVVVAGTLTGVTSVASNTTGQTASDQVTVGHIAVWADDAKPAHSTDVLTDAYGYEIQSVGLSSRFEAATDRLARLCAEDGIALDMPQVPVESVQRMGWQEPGTSLDLYRESEQVDGGILHERGFSLGYLPREARYNQPVTLTIDLAQYTVSGSTRDVLSPNYDDQQLRNQWTVGRRDGSFAVAADPASQRRGVYNDSVELNVAADDQLPDQAAWRLHLDSEVDLREATFPIDVAANPALLDGWLSCRVGSRIVRTNPPGPHRPGDIDRLAMGWTETIGPRSWQVQVVPEPAAPWQVAVVDGGDRVSGDGYTAAAVAASDMTLLLGSAAADGPWTTDPADFPLDLALGGEQVTASAIGPAVSATFGTPASNGWGVADTGQAFTVEIDPALYAVVGGGTARVSTANVGVLYAAHLDTGGSDQTVAATVFVPVVPAGSGISVRVAARMSNTSNYYEAQILIAAGGAATLQLFRRVAGAGASISSGVSVGTHSAGNGWRIAIGVDGTTVRAKAWRPATDTEPDWLLTVTGQTLVPTGTRAAAMVRRESGNTNGSVNIDWDDLVVTTPQRVTLSARGVNGVQRAWPAGTPVDVWAPAYVAL